MRNIYSLWLLWTNLDTRKRTTLLIYHHYCIERALYLVPNLAGGGINEHRAESRVRHYTDSLLVHHAEITRFLWKNFSNESSIYKSSLFEN